MYYSFANIVVMTTAAYLLSVTSEMVGFLTSTQGNIFTKLFWLIFFSISSTGGIACLVDVELGLDLFFVPLTRVCKWDFLAALCNSGPCAGMAV